MTNANLALNSPARPGAGVSLLINSATARPAEPRQDAAASAIDWEERRWQLEWERRNIED